MKVEIEREFLLASDGWRGVVVRSEYIPDGLIAVSDDRKNRVRIIGDRGTPTVTTKRFQGSRFDFEYDIPLADAELLLTSSGANASRRNRCVPQGEVAWEVNEYGGLLKGTLLAEVALTSIHQSVDLLAWIGHEMTAEGPYRKLNMLHAPLKALKREKPK